MNTLENKRVLVTGGSRGLGLGVVEALVERKARVAVIARDEARLAAVRDRLAVRTLAGDVSLAATATSALRECEPEILILNAGATPPMGRLDELTWEEFSATWNNDVRAGFHWIQQALKQPLPRGSRVLIGSSGAAVNGSPLSGAYAGAKRMLWLMANYANGVATERDLGIRFQAILPMQIVGDTALGRAAATAYAAKKGVSLESFLDGFGKPLTPRGYGEYVAAILEDPQYATGTAFAIRADTGIRSLDA